MNSIWTENVALPRFASLEGSVKTDVLIIGGGMAGILCAYFLQEKGVDYILVEGGTIGSGITENTTAKITAQHGLIYDRLLKNEGHEKARMYLEANQNAVKKYFELCEKTDCDFEEKTAYVYSLNDGRKLENEAEALRKIGFSAEITGTEELPFPTVGAVSFKNQAQFHPLKFLGETARNLKIYEHSFVKKLKKNTAFTEKGNITFQKAIFATHFPIVNIYGMYFLKMYQDRSYVLARKDAAQVRGMYLDEAKGGMSFRNYRDFLLIGGGAHRTGKRGCGWQSLRDFADEYYPCSAETYHWAAQDCMTLDGIPYIGPYSTHMPDYYVASGFNKWGMTSAMAAAMILADMIMEHENPWTEVFSPSRSMWKPQLFINAGEAAANLLTFSKKRCTHMGCALKWNGAEHTWDCPCHGSRFGEGGKLIDDPAKKDLKI